jgi:hypothetical protein
VIVLSVTCFLVTCFLSPVFCHLFSGSRQRIMHAVNDKLGIEPDAAPS